MSRVPLREDRRFRRAHVKPARRERWRRPLSVTVRLALVALLVVLVVYRGRDVIAESRVLRVSQIVVRGNHFLAGDDVRALLDGLPGTNIVLADLAAWRQRLLDSPWVEDAVLRRSLPSTMEVTITEREPIAVGRLGGVLYLIDGRGSVIDRFGPRHRDLDLPIVDGLGPARSATTPDEVRAELAARLILSFRAKPEVARRVSQVNVTDPHNAGVILNGDPALLYVGEDRFLPRVEAYLGLAQALRERVSDIDYVDLRFDDRIYVRPLGKPIPPAVAPADGKNDAGAVRSGRPARKR